MTLCKSHMLTGEQCDLEQDHPGEHQKTIGTTVYAWTDESLARASDQWGSRFD